MSTLTAQTYLTPEEYLLMEGECQVFTSEMHVRTSPEVSYFYPDVSVVCGEPRFEDDTFTPSSNFPMLEIV